MPRLFRSLLPLLLVGLQLPLIGQERFDKMRESQLFMDTTILEVTLEFDIWNVISDLKERNNHDGTLSYLDGSGNEVRIDLQLKVRGKTRANPKVCDFPPLRLNFKKSKNDDNLFAGQDKLKLVGHCDQAKSNEQYLLQEYLLYKKYNLLTDFSFRVRLLRINYVDLGSDRKFTKFGFLIEDIESVANRTGTIEGGKVINQDWCNHRELDVMTVFQFMIGNTDWSVTSSHNMKLLAKDSTLKLPIPIPYDFDYSGAINAHYAIPPEILPIHNVQTRYFQGYCRQPGTYEKVFDHFNEKKNAIYMLYNSFKGLSSSKKKQMLRYLDSFYETINNEKKATKAIVEACSVSHRHVY